MELLDAITAYRPWNEQERMDREELLRRLAHLSPAQQETALRLLEVYLNSL